MAVKLTLTTPVKYIKGIGEARASAFERLGVNTVADLLSFYPRAYEERGRVLEIQSAMDGELCSVEVTVRETSAPKIIRKNLSVFRSIVCDDSGSMELVFFNMPFVAKSLTKGKRFRVYGRMRIGLYGREMVSPKLEQISAGKELPYYVPIYRIAAKGNLFRRFGGVASLQMCFGAVARASN